MINVLDGGLSTTVQDVGRFGFYHLGIAPSGAVDDFSLRVANLLVGNVEGAAALETTYDGPRLEFAQDAIVAITGADLPPIVEGHEYPTWEALEIKAGTILSFHYLRSGARAYIAVAGGIDVPEVLGSKSTYSRAGIGGYEGRAIRAGDVLSIGDPPAHPARCAGAKLAEKHCPCFQTGAELRVIMGLFAHLLTSESVQAFLESEWTVNPASDRVGYRYRGIQLEFVARKPPFGAGSDPSNVVDIGYPVGSIQVPGGVEPIVLLNDAVSGGGYATIGTVISADRGRLAQTKPHEGTRFCSVRLEDALRARTELKQRLTTIRAELSRRGA